MASPSLARAHPKTLPPWLLVILAVLAAWFPICRRYLRIGDDFHFAEWLLTYGVGAYFHENGVWRILGHELGNAATLVNPRLPGLLFMATHCAGSLLLLAALRRLLASESLALLLALIFAAFPWGDQVLMWACLYTYLLATTLFIAVVCLMLGAFPIRIGLAATFSIILSALALFAHEAVFFPLLISGGFAMLVADHEPLKQRLSLAASPVIGCGIYAMLLRLFPGRIPPEHTHIHLPTLLSGIYYQYTNWEIFEPWAYKGTRTLLFFAWSPWLYVMALTLVTAVAICAWRTALPTQAAAPTKARAVSSRLLIYLVALLAASVAIYALGGGFSLDSRKKYPVLPALLMLIGCIIQRFAPRLRIHRAAILGITLCGIATTWLQIGLWHYEVTRLDLLVQLLWHQRDPAAVHFEWDSRIQSAWPRSTRHWGAPVEPWVLANAMNVQKLLYSQPSFDPQVKSVKFNPDKFLWEP